MQIILVRGVFMPDMNRIQEEEERQMGQQASTPIMPIMVDQEMKLTRE
jgi:hypothetical protein